MNLLTLGNIERLEEGVHVLPAVQLAEAAKFGLSDRLDGVAGTITVNKLLHMGRLDLAAVVDDFTRRINQRLGQVESGVIDLGETKGYVTVDCQLLKLPKRTLTYI